MTEIQVYLFFALIFLSLGLTFLAVSRKHILLSISAFLSWFTNGIILLTNAFGTTLNDDWTIYLGYVFIILAFSMLLIHMDTEIVVEKDGQKWHEYGSKPNSKRESSYDKYKSELRRRIRR